MCYRSCLVVAMKRMQFTRKNWGHARESRVNDELTLVIQERRYTENNSKNTHWPAVNTHNKVNNVKAHTTYTLIIEIKVIQLFV